MIIIKKFLSIVLIVATALVLLCSCGPKVKNGLVEENGYTYYYVNDEMQTGWQEIKGNWYYFGETAVVPYEEKGRMIKGGFIKDKTQNWYYLDNVGRMLKNQFVVDSGKEYYFDKDGKMILNTQKEINGNTYIFDSEGIANIVPDYQLVFNCTFPKSFISYEIEKRYAGLTFETYWTGTAGNTDSGPNYSTSRHVGYKLYDPENYVIDSGTFYTDVSLKMGEKFKDTKKVIGFGKINSKGTYRLELMDVK